MTVTVVWRGLGRESGTRYMGVPRGLALPLSRTVFVLGTVFVLDWLPVGGIIILTVNDKLLL